MKYVSLVQRYWPAIGGSELYMKKLAEAVAADGHESVVFTTEAQEVDALWYKGRAVVSNPNEELVNRVKVHRMPMKYLPAHGKTMMALSLIPVKGFRERYSMPGPYVEHWLGRIKSLGSADVIHAAALPFTPVLNMGLRAAETLGAKSIASPFMHLAMPKRFGFGFDRPYQIDLLKQYDMLIAQTQAEKDFLVEKGIEESRVKALGLGVDVDELAGGDAARFREKYKVQDRIVFYIGAMTFDKGANHLLLACMNLWERGERFKLILAGQPRDDFLELVAKQTPDVKDRLLVLDSISEHDKKDLLAAGDIFAMPSRAESFGIVYLEAWCYKKPVIAAKIPTSCEIINNGEDGMLAGFGDVDQLTESISSLLNDPDRCKSMGEAGRLKVLSRYVWKDIENKFKDILSG